MIYQSFYFSSLFVFHLFHIPPSCLSPVVSTCSSLCLCPPPFGRQHVSDDVCAVSSSPPSALQPDCLPSAVEYFLLSLAFLQLALLFASHSYNVSLCCTSKLFSCNFHFHVTSFLCLFFTLYLILLYVTFPAIHTWKRLMNFNTAYCRNRAGNLPIV